MRKFRGDILIYSWIMIFMHTFYVIRKYLIWQLIPIFCDLKLPKRICKRGKSVSSNIIQHHLGYVNKRKKKRKQEIIITWYNFNYRPSFDIINPMLHMHPVLLYKKSDEHCWLRVILIILKARVYRLMNSLCLAFFRRHSSTFSKLRVKESSTSCSSSDPTELQSIPNFSIAL